MWPKAFAQLLELIPHISRLLPMADLFFSTKTASEKASEATIAGLAKDVRADLGQVTSAYDGLYRQLQAQSSQLAEMGADTRSIRIAIEVELERLNALERQTAWLVRWLQVMAFLLLLVFGGIAVLLLRVR